jgi:hypothetical protein
MVARLAYAYVSLLIIFELSTIVLMAALHVIVIVGVTAPCTGCGAILFNVSLVLGFPAAAFLRYSHEWMKRIKSCPAWMWKTALGLGAYSLVLPFDSGTLWEFSSLRFRSGDFRISDWI